MGSGLDREVLEYAAPREVIASECNGRRPPAIDALEVDRPGRPMVEITEWWGDSLQRVVHIERSGSFDIDQRAKKQRGPLVRVIDGRAFVTLTQGIEARIESPCGVRRIAADDAEALSFAVRMDETVGIVLGVRRVAIRHVPRVRHVARRRRLDAGMLWGVIAAVIAVGSVLSAALVARRIDPYLEMADTHASDLDELRHMMAFAHTHAPYERLVEDTRERVWSSPVGAAHTEASGTMGRPDSLDRDRHYTLARRRPAPELSRPPARDVVARRGVFAALGATAMVASGHGAVSPFGGMLDTGNDPDTDTGRMTALYAGDAFGSGGLGRVGIGFGGGGAGEGTIGTAPWGGIGAGRGSCGCGEGMPIGSLRGIAGFRTSIQRNPHPVLPPSPEGSVVLDHCGDATCRPSVSGFLSADAIRRVVLRNLGQVRRCHEQGLAQDPNVAGRVTIRFIIGEDGNVLGAAVTESTVRVPSVPGCIASAVRRWTFPAPDGGGIVTVNYPFTLQTQ